MCIYDGGICLTLKISRKTWKFYVGQKIFNDGIILEQRRYWAMNWKKRASLNKNLSIWYRSMSRENGIPFECKVNRIKEFGPWNVFIKK